MRVGFLFHLQFDFKQARLMKLQYFGEDLSFSRGWRVEQKDSSTVTVSVHIITVQIKKKIPLSGSEVSDNVH